MNHYDEQVHKLGRRSVIICLILILSVPLITSLYYGIFPPLSSLFSALSQVLMIYIPISVAEFFTFAPMIGKGGSYLAFITGNLTNLKIPCASIALKNSGYKTGSEEAEVINTLAIASSALTTIILLVLGLFLANFLSPILSSPAIQPAIDYILPSLFGALGAHFFIKQWKLAIIPLGLSIVFAFLIINVFFLDFNQIQGLLIPVLGALSMVSARISYKKGWITKKDMEES